MRIAVAYEDGKIFQHFGHTECFKLYDVEGGQILSGQIIHAPAGGHGALAEFLSAARVDAVICGGIGGGARTALAEAGIELYPGVSGSADAAVNSLLNGTLLYNPDTVCAHHHHEDGHDCGSHSCGEDKHGCAGNH